MTNPDNVGGLLPCPFCGHDDSLYIEHVEGTIRHPAYYVRCDYCGAQNGSTDSGEHVKKWNERAELCRAAPAGGDVERFSPDCEPCSDFESWVGCMRPDPNGQWVRYAPAGSGEVDALVDELILAARANARSASSQGFEMTEAIHLSYEVNFRQIRALLRKLQQGAE